jgi:hypothetical protein
MKVSFHADQDFLDFMLDELDLDLSKQHLDGPSWFTVTVRNEHDAVVAALACEFWSTFDCKFTAAIADERAITPKLLHVIFGTLFSKVVRITAEADPDNEATIDRLQRLGFVYEGFKRKGLDGFKDAVLYGMLVEDCKFFPPGVRAAPENVSRETSGGPDGITAQSA